MPLKVKIGIHSAQSQLQAREMWPFGSSPTYRKATIRVGQVTKLIVVGLVMGAILLMTTSTTSTAWAAQGQTTEVNPSGRGVPLRISNIPYDILVVLSVVANPFRDILSYFLVVVAFA
jgi:hypothetical protein